MDAGRFILAVVLAAVIASPAVFASQYLLRPILGPWVHHAVCAVIGYAAGRYVASWLYERWGGR